MPVSGHDGKRILDYGCGPGHDLVGILEHSRPGLLVGADVSPTARAIAARRVLLHPGGSQAVIVSPEEHEGLSADDLGHFDYIHSSGVLHHIEDPLEVLQVFTTILAPDGRIRLMVYNRDSIWRNFYVPYVLQHRRRAIGRSVDLDNAFRMSTDGPNCPVSRSYDAQSLRALARTAGLECEVIGVSMSQHELRIWRDYREVAGRDRVTPPSVRHFMESVVMDDSGLPLDASGNRPGINLVVELRPYRPR
jgi:hypothetical protein